MCGIAGFVGPGGGDEAARAALTRMTDAIAHRGPDDSGQWVDLDAEVALGHRRLAVLDLTPEGHQPMVSAGGRYVIVFNGEVYNWADLRQAEEAAGVRFRGHSDTEVMLAVIERHGVREATTRFAGMFAFALWDRAERTLHLVRDRLGEKPLYYGFVGSHLLFGSELGSLQAHPVWQGTIDRDALALYLRYNYVPAPRSIFVGIRKVEPATIVSIGPARTVETTAYWSLRDVAQQAGREPLRGSTTEILDQVEARLRETIGQEMISDVPLGAFLSGGIDSSTIVALMQSQSSRPVKTFTIGFRESDFDEADHARAVARHLGTEHTELYLTPAEAMAVLDRSPPIGDEPFGDPSQIPTYLVASLARQHVTVALSGDGGDELFGGYNRYLVGQRMWKWIGAVPSWMRQPVAGGLRAVPPGVMRGVVNTAQRVLPARARMPQAVDRIQKMATVLAAESGVTMYRSLVSNWDPPSEILVGGREPATLLTSEPALGQGLDFVADMMYLDARTYLSDDIMVKVDRASMAVSLESRAPLLDHRVVELAWRIPAALRFKDGRGKWVLRSLLDRHVPRSITDRPKMGFGVPIDAWLRGPLKRWAEGLLDPVLLKSQGWFDPDAVWRRWVEHQSGRHNRQYPLWNLLMFQAWLARPSTRV
jgi:asparagine synthase (glutamine-hydrolysing)